MCAENKADEVVYSVIICLVYLALALIGMTMIKLGHGGAKGIKIPVVGFISIKLIIGLFFYVFSFLLFVFFVSKMKISVVLPIISGVNCALTAVIGVLVFKESVTILQIFGIAFIAIGTVLVGMFKK